MDKLPFSSSESGWEGRGRLAREVELCTADTTGGGLLFTLETIVRWGFLQTLGEWGAYSRCGWQHLPVY